MFVTGCERVLEPGALALGEAVLAGAQDVADPVQRVVAAAAVPAGVLQDSAPHIVHAAVASLTTWNASSTATASLRSSSMVLRYLRNVSSVATLTPDRNACPRSVSHSSTPHPCGRGPGPAAEPGCGRAQVHHPGQLLRAATAVLDRLGRHVVPHVLTHRQGGTPSKRVGSAAASYGTGLMLVHTVFHVVPSWGASPRTEACSGRIWAIARRRARGVSQPPPVRRRPGPAPRTSACRTDTGYTHRPLCHAIRVGRLCPGGVDQRHADQAVPVRNNPTRRAAHHLRFGLHRDRQRPVALVPLHGDHVRPGKPTNRSQQSQ